jgi:hypothetical protein
MRLPVFVCYTYRRTCNHNPSMDRFMSMPKPMQRDIINAMEARDANRKVRAKAKKKGSPD